MAQWAFDYAIHGNDAPRVIECGACKDSRITAMWIDQVSNVGLYPSTDVFPWTVQNAPYGDMRATGDVKDRMVYDRLPGTGEPLPYAPIGREQWHTDYPGDAVRDAPQGLSLLAAAIVAARRAINITGGGGVEGGDVANRASGLGGVY